MIHKIIDWSHVIRISQKYKLEPWDQDITKLQSGTMGSGYHKIKNWNHGIKISQNYRLEPWDKEITKLHIGTM